MYRIIPANTPISGIPNSQWFCFLRWLFKKKPYLSFINSVGSCLKPHTIPFVLPPPVIFCNLWTFLDLLRHCISRMFIKLYTKLVRYSKVRWVQACDQSIRHSSQNIGLCQQSMKDSTISRIQNQARRTLAIINKCYRYYNR